MPPLPARPADDPLLRGLNERQARAVTNPADTLVILAGAGSGKTRVLTRRIAWLARERRVDTAHALAVTFTRKAAGELTQRLRGLGLPGRVTAGTFHGLAWGQLRRRAADRGEAEMALLERKGRLLGPILARSGSPAGENRPALALEAAAVASEIEWAKARLLTPDRFEAAVAAAGRQTSRPAGELAELYARYEEEKTRRRLVDFDDLLWRLAEAIESDPGFAATQHWRFRHFFVDEFQDVRPAQFRLIRAWLGGRPDLCAVGDDDQAIYGFSGADAAYLVNFKSHFPGAAVVSLAENYRSSPQVLAAANAVLPSGRRTKGHLVPTQPDGPLPVVTAYASEAEEARAVARALLDAHYPGTTWSSMAVLYRTNAQSVPFEAALRAAGVPFRVRGAARFLERPEVVAALDELRQSAAGAPGVPLASHLIDLQAWADGLAATDSRRDHAEAIVRLAQDYLAEDGGAGSTGTTGSIAGLMAYLSTSLADDDAGGLDDAVELLTFHKAKGLEWPLVFVTGLERGFVPIAYAETLAALAEERRLLYVALTRAQRELRLSWAQRRTLGARHSVRQASPYLSVIEVAVAAMAPGASGDWRAAVAAERERLAALRAADQRHRRGPGANADPRVLADLVEWRRGLARASGVPAQVIFHDATLAALADLRPQDREALLAVPGLGPIKVARYGESLLELVGRHAPERLPGRAV